MTHLLRLCDCNTFSNIDLEFSPQFLMHILFRTKVLQKKDPTAMPAFKIPDISQNLIESTLSNYCEQVTYGKNLSLHV